MSGTNPFNSRMSGLSMSVDPDRLTIRVGPGSAYVPNTRRISTDTDLTVTLTAPTPSQWRHVYLFLNNGNAAIEAVTTAPDVTYQGTARLKTGDPTRRYVGSIYVGSDGLLVQVQHTHPTTAGSRVDILTPNGLADPYPALLINGIATTSTNVSAANAVPPTSRLAILDVQNTTTLPMYLSNPDRAPVSATRYLRQIRAGMGGEYTLPLDSQQRFNYMFAGILGLGNGNIRVIGYFYNR